MVAENGVEKSAKCKEACIELGQRIQHITSTTDI